MSYHRRYSYDPRAESPPPIDRIPTPPHRVLQSNTRYRSPSPRLVTRLPTPPYLETRSTSPVVRDTVRTIRTYRTQTGLGTRISNLFRPRPRSVEIIQSPVRRTQSTSIRFAPSPPPAISRRHTVRRAGSPPPPPAAPLVQPTPPSGRRNRYHGMSPRLPGDYVPLPPRQPLAQDGNPTPPQSKERSGERRAAEGRPHRPSPGHRDFTEYHASPWQPQEQVDEQPQVVTDQRPVRSRPDNREATLTRQNEEYRGELKRVSRELEKTQINVVDLLQKLEDAEDRAQRASTEADRAGSAVDELRRQLRNTQQQVTDERDRYERERSTSDRLSQELDHLRRQGPRETVLHQPVGRGRGRERESDRDLDRPAARPLNENAGLQAIREAQANRGRGRGGNVGGPLR